MSPSVRRTRMRDLAVALLVTLAVGTAWAGVKAGDRAADFTLPTLDGAQVKLADLKGSVVVLDFWASWCVPCKKELPALDVLARRWAAEGKPVIVLAVNIDKDRGNAEKLLASAKIEAVRVLLDPDGKVAGAFDLPTMPSSYIIDKNGLVRNVHAGFSSGDERKIADEVDALVSAK